MAQKKYISLSKLSTFLDNLKNTFALLSHKHAISDITDYAVDDTLSSSSTNPVQNKVLDAEFEAISEAMNVYDLALNDKANVSHTHEISDVTNLQSSLDEVNEVVSQKSQVQVITSDATETLSTLKIHKMTQEEYDQELENGTLDANALYLTPDKEIDLSEYATTEQLNGKADIVHTHDDIYYTETEIDSKLATKSDTSHNHDDDYDEIGSAAAVQANLDGLVVDFEAHEGNTGIHVTSSEKSNWNTAYTHSQAAHARTDATKVADSTTNGNILINETETNVYTHPTSGVSAGTYKSVTVDAQGHITAGTNPTTLAGYGITDAEAKGAASSALADAKEYTDTAAAGKADASHTHNDIYYTETEVDELITSHRHDSLYDANGSANTALEAAKTYTDNAVAQKSQVQIITWGDDD